MAVRAKSYLIFLFSVMALLFSATVTLARNEKNADIVVCLMRCEKLPGEEQLSCKQTCEEYHDQEPDRKRRDPESPGGKSGGSGSGGWRLKNREEDFDRDVDRDFDGEGGQESNNPYVFEDRHFAGVESQLGRVRVLEKFTDRSDLLRGIEEYRVGFVEAEPQTFIIPNHYDADSLLFIVNGEGAISLINPKSKRQTINLKRGDIFRVPAGISVYLINRNNNQKLVFAQILRSASVPGELQTFMGVGTENRESSFLNAFSTEVLEAAYGTNRDEIERLFFGQQSQKGVIRKATAEQIKSLEESKLWPFGEGKGAYNVIDKKPSIQNQNGHLHEVDSDDYSELREMNIAISHMNISQGSMAGPFYHTRSTMVFVVPNGEGKFEMACPHLSEQRSRDENIVGSLPSFEKVSSPLRQGTVVVVPAGHPVVIENTGNQDLELIGFGLNSDKNEWFPLAGKDNVMNEWEDEAVELTFGVPARAVKKVIQKQKQRLFFKGPARSGRAFV